MSTTAADEAPGHGGPPLATQAVLSILTTATRLLEELQPVFAEHHTTALRFDVLDALGRLGRPARPAELKVLLHLPPQTLTGAIDALEGAGLARRLPHPTDRRSVLVELTPEGGAAIERICPPLVDIEEACMAALAERDQRRLVDLLAKVQQAVSERRGAR
jgi:DNA-binding MarR family transcriptional regulator